MSESNKGRKLSFAEPARGSDTSKTSGMSARSDADRLSGKLSGRLSGKLSELSHPLIQGGMGIGISMGGLAGAVAAEGAMGVISTANIGFTEEDFWQNPDGAAERSLRREIRKAREISGGKGLLAINAMVVTNNYRRMVEAAAEEGIDAVISGAGLPLELPELLAGSDVLVAPIVSGAKAARTITNLWSRRYGRTPDFIVAEGSMAGGHLGFGEEELMDGSCKPLEEIVADIRRLLPELPIFAGGSVFDRDDIDKMIKAGADGVQIATRFIATEECDASDGYKQTIIDATEDDVMIVKSPVGMPGRGLRTPLTEKTAKGLRVPPQKCINCIRTCEPKTTPYCINKALIEAYKGNYEEGLFFCGGNVGRVNEMTTVRKLIEELFPRQKGE